MKHEKCYLCLRTRVTLVPGPYNLEGIWDTVGLTSGDAPQFTGWSYGSWVIEGNGDFTASINIPAGTNTPTGTFLISSDGILTGGPIHGVMNPDKNVFVFTADDGGGGYGLWISSKRDSTPFSTTALAGTWYIHGLVAGDAPQWTGWGNGVANIDHYGNFSSYLVNSDCIPNSGDGRLIIEGTQISGAGDDPSLHGMMNADKNLIAFTMDDGGNGYGLWILFRNIAAPVLGDINNDGITGFPEAIHALQVLAGTRNVGNPDHVAINQVLDIVEKLFETSTPTAEELNQFAPYISDDFLNHGLNKTQELETWAAGEGGPQIGMSISAEIIEPLDVSGTGYLKGYWVNIHGTSASGSETFATSMVYDGTRWLWHGDRRWLDISFGSEALKDIHSSGVISYSTGFYFWINDAEFAYNNGVRSAIISGPGLPVKGIVLTHMYPKDQFETHPNIGNHIIIDDDSILSSIPDDASYTFNFYSEAADIVSLSNTPLFSYTESLRKRPILNSDLDASLFPVLIAPTSHQLSAANIPGILSISWTIPANITIHSASLTWSVHTESYSVAKWLGQGETTATFDTIGYDAPTHWAGIRIEGNDADDAKFSMRWEFSD